MQKILKNSENFSEKNDFSCSLGENLKKIRQEKGFTQKSLSEKSGVSYTTITKIEIGVIKEPSVFSCYKIAKTLGISMEELIGEN